MKKIFSFLTLLITLSFFAQNTYVPDVNFEQALINLGYDSVLDNYVLTSNINTITSLDVSNYDIMDLTGIEDFTALTELKCNNNQLTGLDVSHNTLLTLLYCDNNQLSNLDLSHNTNLNNLSCSNNQLSGLDLSLNTNIAYLNCHHNQISSLGVSSNTSLKGILCHYNQLISLDVSLNTALVTLFCNNNQLSSLNVKNGNNISISNFSAINNPNLSCIEVDDATYSTANWANIDATASFSEDCSAANVNEDTLNEAIIIYPNPAKNIINIKTYSSDTITTLSLSNALGETVYKTSTIPNTIDTSKFKTGLYILKITGGNKSITKKIIISK